MPRTHPTRVGQPETLRPTAAAPPPSRPCRAAVPCLPKNVCISAKYTAPQPAKRWQTRGEEARTEYLAALPDLLRCGHAVEGERFVDDVLAPEAHVRGAEMEVWAMLGSVADGIVTFWLLPRGKEARRRGTTWGVLCRDQRAELP